MPTTEFIAFKVLVLHILSSLFGSCCLIAQNPVAKSSPGVALMDKPRDGLVHVIILTLTISLDRLRNVYTLSWVFFPHFFFLLKSEERGNDEMQKVQWVQKNVRPVRHL